MPYVLTDYVLEGYILEAAIIGSQCSGVQSGHGTTIAIELDPTAQPGIFTTIAQLNGDITWGFSRPEEDVTGHEFDIDTWVLGVFSRDSLVFTVNYIFDDPTHSSSISDSSHGLLSKLRTRDCFGYRLRGPGGSDSVDEWIASGQVQLFNVTSPVRVGARTAECSIRASGPMMFDGELQE